MVKLFNGIAVRGGAVGRMNLSDFSSVLDELNAVLGDSKNAEYLKTIFHRAYSSDNLSQATRVLINELFKDDGLVIIVTMMMLH